MQNGYVPLWLLRIVRVMRPSVDSGCRRMAAQIENLNDSFPYGLALKRLFHWNAFNVRRLGSV